MLWKFLCMFAFLFLTEATLLSQDGGRTIRVDFEKGKTSAHFEEQVDMMNPHRYLIHVKRRQVLSIKLDGKQLFLRLFDPSKRTLANLEKQTELKVVTKTAKKTGDYLLLVQCFCEKSPLYKLNISVK